MVVKKGYLIAGGLVIAVLVIGLIVSIGRSGNTEKPVAAGASGTNKTDAAEQAVRKTVTLYLKSPGSAQFSDVVSRQKTNQPNSFIVFGDVDSQNSYGALLRSHFFAELDFAGGSLEDASNWKLERFDLGGMNYFSDGKPENPPFALGQELSDVTRKLEDLYRDSK